MVSSTRCGVGRGHRLHPDRVVAADDRVADVDFAGLVAGELVLIHHRMGFLWGRPRECLGGERPCPVMVVFLTASRQGGGIGPGK